VCFSSFCSCRQAKASDLTFFKVRQQVCFCSDIKVEIVKFFYEIELSTFDFNDEHELMFCDAFASHQRLCVFIIVDNRR